MTSGALARVRLRGGVAPAHDFVDGVQWADWSPVGGLAVVRDAGGRNVIEYPAGRVVYETGGWVSHPRFSPEGDRIAFIDHPVPADDSGSVAVVRVGGEARIISGGWVSAQGLAWGPNGEVWFTATEAGNARSLWAVAPGGEKRIIYRGMGSLTLHDLTPDGRALLTRDNTRLEIFARAGADAAERELTWLDWSLARDLSDDGRTLLFTEAGEGGGATYGVYLRPTDGGAAARLGEGSALALSPDGRWVLAVRHAPAKQLVLLPTRGGAPKLISRAPLNYQPWAAWFPCGRRVLFAANRADRGTQLYVQSIEDDAPACVTPGEEGVELTSTHPVSPDGRLVAALGADRQTYLYSLDGPPRRHAVRGVEPGEAPVGWTRDGRSLYVRRRGAVPARIFRVRLSDGRRESWGELAPADLTGVSEILRVLLTADADAYTCTRNLSDLYLVEGLV